jgi:hypothetical protein
VWPWSGAPHWEHTLFFGCDKRILSIIHLGIMVSLERTTGGGVIFPMALLFWKFHEGHPKGLLFLHGFIDTVKPYNQDKQPYNQSAFDDIN